MNGTSRNVVLTAVTGCTIGHSTDYKAWHGYISVLTAIEGKSPASIAVTEPQNSKKRKACARRHIATFL